MRTVFDLPWLALKWLFRTPLTDQSMTLVQAITNGLVWGLILKVVSEQILPRLFS